VRSDERVRLGNPRSPNALWRVRLHMRHVWCRRIELHCAALFRRALATAKAAREAVTVH